MLIPLYYIPAPSPPFYMQYEVLALAFYIYVYINMTDIWEHA